MTTENQIRKEADAADRQARADLMQVARGKHAEALKHNPDPALVKAADDLLGVAAGKWGSR